MRRCVVPTCSFRNNKSNNERRSMFHYPKDENKARRWAEQIPGLDKSLITKNQVLCEKHFEPRFIKRYYEKNSPKLRSRLSQDALPTIFDDINTNNFQTPTFFFNNDINHSQNTMNDETSLTVYNNSITQNQMSSTFLNNTNSCQTYTTSVVAPLQDIVKDLSTSEKLLMDIKQEMFPITEDPKVKLENWEDCAEKVKVETDLGLKELSVYEQLQINLHHYATLLPDSWNISQLLVGNDQVFVISKECTVCENEALVVMYEKNIVVNKNGNVHYSVHGKMLNINHPCFPTALKDLDSLLNVILNFNNFKVCQGVCTKEFEVDKDYTVYTDDLGFCRHVQCTLISDKLQCDFCLQYSRYLNIMTNNTPVLNNEPISYDKVY